MVCICIVLSLPPFRVYIQYFWHSARGRPFCFCTRICLAHFEYCSILLLVEMAYHRRTTMPLKSTISTNTCLIFSSQTFFMHLSFIVDYLFLLHCGCSNIGSNAFFISFFVVGLFVATVSVTTVTAISIPIPFVSIEFNGWLDSFLVVCVARDNWQTGREFALCQNKWLYCNCLFIIIWLLIPYLWDSSEWLWGAVIVD